MKSVALQKAVNVIKSGSWTSPVDFRYQDETSQFKVDCDRVAAQKRGQTYTPKPWEALPYLAKDEMGKIHVRGFLHDHVARNPNGSFSHRRRFRPRKSCAVSGPRGLLMPARARHASESSSARFSISKEFHDTLVASGRNPDLALRGVIERSMRSFQEKFHPGDSVGYSYGLHHDTDNLHAHVFIHPRTREGDFVGMSGKPANTRVIRRDTRTSSALSVRASVAAWRGPERNLRPERGCLSQASPSLRPNILHSTSAPYRAGQKRLSAAYAGR